ncbi:hypothetical protein [Ensifer sp. SL37]|uniref:hypothetical protein n=1 Tax=Ensifer sp. SL37 TaxID=2995137 RepID=UPI00227429A5|nr:hypothetical protein [Ensifer sp. SL37]MCY1741010.1 hypothetical protein [Ensifer sp. SL37]
MAADLEAGAVKAIEKERNYMTFSNDVKMPPTYKTAGGCTAYDPPEIAYKTLVGSSSDRILRKIYRRQVVAGIEKAGNKCSCELRFPTWDAALQEYETRFANLADDDSSAWVFDFVHTEMLVNGENLDDFCSKQGVF